MATNYDDPNLWPAPVTFELEPMQVTPGAPSREPHGPYPEPEEPEAPPAANPFQLPDEAFQSPIELSGEPGDFDDPALWPQPTPAVAPVDLSEFQGDPLWSDYGKLFMSGGASVGAGMGWVLEKLGAEDIGGAIKERGLESAKWWTEELSPQAQIAMQQELLGQSMTGDAKFNKIKLMTAGSLLGTMAGAGLGSVMTKGLQAAGAGAGAAATVGFGLGEALVAAPAGAAATEQQVRDMPLSELSKGLEFQAALLSLRGDMDDEEKVEKARDMVARAAGNEAGALSLITTFALSAPFGKILDKLYRGGAAKGAGFVNRGAGAARGGAAEATQEFLQSGAEKFAENLAMLNVDPTMNADRLAAGVLEEALAGAGSGGLLGGPMGARIDPAAQAAADEDARLKLVEEVQKRVEEQARLEGADDLEATLVGEETAADFAESIVADLREQEALDRAAVETEPVVEGPEPQAEITDKEVAAEVKTELEREVIQKEAGERYTKGAARNLTEQRAYAAREAEIEAQKVKDAAKARGQVEMQKGEGTAAIEEAGVAPEPATTPMGQALRVAQQKAKAEKSKTLEGRRILEKEKAKPALLEDQRPSVVVVDPEGAARPMTAGELDAQIRRRKDLIEQGDLNLTGDWGKNAPNIPVRVMGLDLEIENPKGTTRSGTTPEGKKWTQKFEGAHYGNIKGVRGADNERLDVYIGEQDWRPKGQKIWVVNQYKPDGTFDEHKVMMGFANEQEAVNVYEQHNGGEMPRGETVEMTPGEFKRWAFRGKIKNKPLASPNVLRVGTMEDVQAVQERAVFKGRGRPKILYKKADVVVEEVAAPTDEKVASLTEDLSPDGTILEAKEAGEAVGNIVMDRRGNKMQVIWTMVKMGLRGKGTGKNLLLSAVRKANEKGFELVSDSSVSLDQLRVYESLRKTGQLVAEYADPRAVQEFMESNKDTPSNSGVTLQLGAMQPVVNRMFIPEYAETIRLRKEEQMDFEGYSYSETRATIDLLLNLMPGIKRENVNILDSFADLPRELQEVLRAKKQEGAPGFYVQDTDQVYLILDNNASLEAATSIFMHEAVAHHGLRRVFGKNIQPLLEDISEGLKNSKALDRIAERYELDLTDPLQRLDAVEEYIAHEAERQPNSSIVARVVGAIRQILRQAGLISSWTDNDIQLLLRDVRRELQAKPLDKIVLTSEAEVEETGEVVTLKQTADVALRRLDKRAGVLEQVRGCLG